MFMFCRNSSEKNTTSEFLVSFDFSVSLKVLKTTILEKVGITDAEFFCVDTEDAR